MIETNKLHLQLFEGKDKFDFNVLNENMHKIEDAHSAINIDYYYETLMKNATFEYLSAMQGFAHGQIMGYCLFWQSTYNVMDEYQIIVSNGVETHRLDCTNTSNQITGIKDDVEFVSVQIQYDNSSGAVGVWRVTLNGAFYQRRTEDVKITILHKMQEEKILVRSDGTPLTKPLILDPSIDYSVLPFKGDETLQAIIDGREILIRVPNADGKNFTANYMPIVQRQLPNIDNNYLYLIYMKDGIEENFKTALSTGDFSALYGQIKMELSKTYTETPLK